MSLLQVDFGAVAHTPAPACTAPHAVTDPDPMSLLAIQLPPRKRLGPRAPDAEAAAASDVPALWSHCFSTDGRTAGPLRQAQASALPKAERVVLVLAPSDVSWHRLRLPRAPAARMRQALLGALEEQLLEDEDALHLALAPDARVGQDGWVAAAHAPQLKAAVAALEAAGLRVAQLAPMLGPPGSRWRAHFSVQDMAAGESVPALGGDQPKAHASLWWTLSTDSGAWHVPLLHAHQRAVGGLALALRDALPDSTSGQTWTTTPAAARAAQRFMGRPLPLQSPAEHLLEAARSASNLRQFELLSSHRSLAALRNLGHQMGLPPWRPVRKGLWVLAAVQLAGLNAHAWNQNQQLQARRSGLAEVLRSSFPQVPVVLDAPLQMRTETGRLRTQAGQPAAADLEAGLAAAAAAWPEGKPAVAGLRFEAGRLTLSSPAWTADEQTAFNQRLAPGGWVATHSDGLVLMQHAQAAAGRP